MFVGKGSGPPVGRSAIALGMVPARYITLKFISPYYRLQLSCVPFVGIQLSNWHITAKFEIGFHALRGEMVSRTLGRDKLGPIRIVWMQGPSHQTYSVRFLQNINTSSSLYT